MTDMKSSCKGMRINGVELNLDAISHIIYNSTEHKSQVHLLAGFVITATGDWREIVRSFRTSHFIWTDGKTFESRK